MISSANYICFRYSIDDLLTPNSSLTNITALQNGDTARSLLASHDGLTTNQPPPASSSSTVAATIDPLHEFLLGNRTAFDDINGQQQRKPSLHGAHTSPLQTQRAAAVTTSPNNRLKPIGTTDIGSSSLIINGKNRFGSSTCQKASFSLRYTANTIRLD